MEITKKSLISKKSYVWGDHIFSEQNTQVRFETSFHGPGVWREDTCRRGPGPPPQKERET